MTDQTTAGQPPVDRAALRRADAVLAALPELAAQQPPAARARVAEAALAAVEGALGDSLVPSARVEALAGITAVLPAPADRAAVRAAALHEAADFVGNDDECDCGGCDTCVPNRLADELRRMADEAQAETPPYPAPAAGARQDGAQQ